MLRVCEDIWNLKFSQFDEIMKNVKHECWEKQ